MTKAFTRGSLVPRIRVELVDGGSFCRQRAFRHLYMLFDINAKLAGQLSKLRLSLETEWAGAKTANPSDDLFNPNVGRGRHRNILGDICCSFDTEHS